MEHENDTSIPVSTEKTIPPLKLNPDDYRQDLAAFNMTEQEENELLETLWNIMKTLVEIGWGVNSVQYLLPDIFDDAASDSVFREIITEK